MVVVLPVRKGTGHHGASIPLLHRAKKCGNIGQAADFVEAVFKVLPINKKRSGS